MKTKMLGLGLVLALSLQAMPMSADSGFSLSRLRARGRDTKSWIKKNPKRTIGIAAAVATTAVVAYLCKGQIKSGYKSLSDIYHIIRGCDDDIQLENLQKTKPPTN